MYTVSSIRRDQSISELRAARAGRWPRAASTREVSIAASRAGLFPRVVVANVLPAVEDRRGAGELLATGTKRLLDVAGSALLLLVLLPLIAVVALLIKATSRGPVFFAQPRIGYRCETFRMYKLRSMVDGAASVEEDLAESLNERTFFKIENDARVTPLGRWLRRFSIDELPQLWNVLRGDMSLVGPRPLLLVDLRRFPRWSQGHRFSVKPGLTGLWQVSGRSRLSDSERMRLDLEYVDRWSLWLDLKLLARTIPAVVSTDGAY